jgi:drug/metabolite transporter (DMT)-like permease
VPALPFATWRAVAAALMMAAFLGLLVRAGRAPLTPWRAVPGLDRLQLAALGLFTAGTTVSLFLAFERMSISLTLMIFYAYPPAVAVAAARLHGERLTPDRVAAIVLVTAGMVLVVMAPQLESGALEIDGIGVAFALVASACQGIYALVAARGFRSVPSFQAATLIRWAALGVYVVLVIPIIVLAGDADALWQAATLSEAWALVLVAASLGAAIPAVALVAGYRAIGSVRGAILMLFEPVVGVALAALLLGERPAPLQLVGGLLVLAGATLATVSPRVPVSGALAEPGPGKAE